MKIIQQKLYVSVVYVLRARLRRSFESSVFFWWRARPARSRVSLRIMQWVTDVHTVGTLVGRHEPPPCTQETGTRDATKQSGPTKVLNIEADDFVQLLIVTDWHYWRPDACQSRWMLRSMRSSPTIIGGPETTYQVLYMVVCSWSTHSKYSNMSPARCTTRVRHVRKK